MNFVKIAKNEITETVEVSDTYCIPLFEVTRQQQDKCFVLS